MEALWILIPLIVLAVIGFAWLGNNEQLNPKELIMDECLGLFAAFLFGVFGFSWHQFKEKNIPGNAPVED